MAATQLLVAMFPPAYFLNQDLLMLAGLKVVNMSLRHGNSPMSSAGYVLYALALTAVLGFPETGWAFGRLSADLAERYGNPAFSCKALLIFAAFVNFWRKPIRSSDPILERALDLSLTAGDLQYANYCIIGLGHHAFIRGAPIKDLLGYFRGREDAVRDSKDPFAIETFVHWKQCAMAMAGETKGPSSMSAPGYDEDEAEARIRKSNNSTLLVYFYIRKVFLEAIAGDPVEALEYARRARILLHFTPGNLIVADYHFWSAVAAARVLLKGSSSAPRLKRFLRGRHRTLLRFAKSAPENFAHLAAVISAELQAVESGELRAFDRAIVEANARAAPHIAGVANERAAAWYTHHGQPNIAALYNEAARIAYMAWGATAKAAQIGEAAPASASKASAIAPIPRELVAALADARVPGQHVTAQVRTLMGAAVDFLGDTRVVLLSTGDQDTHVAAAAYGSNHPKVKFPRRGETGESFSWPVANFVRRSRRPLVLAEPAADKRFAACAYLAHTRPGALFALPLQAGDELMGILQFERQVASDTDEAALEAAQMIAAELATILHQSRLEKELAITRETLAQTQGQLGSAESVARNLSKFVPRAVSRYFAVSNPEQWAKTDQPVAILFLDIAGYTRMSEALERTEIIELIQQYFTAFLDELHALGGEMCDMAGDGLMILFQGDEHAAFVPQALKAAAAVRARAAVLNATFAGRFPPVVVNMGLHAGVASVGPMKLEGVIEQRWVYTATGSTVNLAARIGAFAKNGAILVSEEAAKYLREGWAFEDLGPQRFKNVGELVRVFRVMDEVGS